MNLDSGDRWNELQKTNEDWLDEVDEILESLRDQRNEIRDRVGQENLEVSDLFESAERRWRRIRRKLDEARANPGRPLNQSRARNVDLLIEAIEEAYYQIENSLD